MARLAVMLTTLALLAACAELQDVALILPSHVNAQLMLGCESRAPVGECAVDAGAIQFKHTWRF